MRRNASSQTTDERPMESRALHGKEGIEQARGRFGGLDTGATLAGAFAALGITVLLGGIFAGAGRVVYVNGLRDAPSATTGSVVAGIAVIVVAFLVGGWVAGRMARYDGGRNGMVTAVWFILFAAATSALGALLGESYNVFAGQHLPQWFTSSARTPAAVLSAALALLLMLGAGYVGGLVGDRYHRRIDRLVAGLTPVDMPAATRTRQGERPIGESAPARRRWMHARKESSGVSGAGRGEVTTRQPDGGELTTRQPGGGEVTQRQPGGGEATTRQPGGGEATTRQPGGGEATTRQPGGGEVRTRGR